ncbi:hypothetical protein [Thiothrix eikelboomii]|uniref:hypothetical protein n=1 Tax=Thiothrix eikelboomii TaxID=92487 RepID=UPI003BAFEAE5
MKPEKIDYPDYLDNQAADRLVDFIVRLIQFEEGFESFSLSAKEKQRLIEFLVAETGCCISENDSPDVFQTNVLHGIKFLKINQKYKDIKIRHNRNKLLAALEEHNIPRERFVEIADPANTFHPGDCMALLDWPDYRRPANGRSGRLENAGQFIKRLFEEGLYDEKKFGKLYLFDLRNVNPRLYQALVQYQKRTGEKILDSKQDEINELMQKSETEDSLDFHKSSRVSNARWRKQVAIN